MAARTAGSARWWRGRSRSSPCASITAYVGYIAHEHILGLSKLTRLVRLFARRFTVQERTGQQLADGLERILAPRKTLTEIAREVRDLTARARARKLTPDELSGDIFTISNLGMYGIRQFTAVINPPQAAILAVGEAVRQPVVRGDQVAIDTTMTLTLSIDHRAVDGATAAAFLTHLRELIEQPLVIVL